MSPSPPRTHICSCTTTRRASLLLLLLILLIVPIYAAAGWAQLYWSPLVYTRLRRRRRVNFSGPVQTLPSLCCTSRWLGRSRRRLLAWPAAIAANALPSLTLQLPAACRAALRRADGDHAKALLIWRRIGSGGHAPL